MLRRLGCFGLSRAVAFGALSFFQPALTLGLLALLFRGGQIQRPTQSTALRKGHERENEKHWTHGRAFAK